MDLESSEKDSISYYVERRDVSLEHEFEYELQVVWNESEDLLKWNPETQNDWRVILTEIW